MDKRKILWRITWVLWIAAIVAVSFLSVDALCSCSASRTSAAESYASMDSVSSYSSSSLESVAAVTQHSSGAVSVVADSVKLFPIRFSEQTDEPHISGDSFKPRQKPVLPAFSASLYGVRLDLSKDCSSSLFMSDAAVSEDSVSAHSLDTVSKELSASDAESQSCLWGIAVFVFLILAVLLLMRYLDR